jgi:excisionase family DNA binding protein
MKDRLTIQEAAARLGVKEDAVRKRIQRGSLRHEKSPEGRVYVWVDAAQDAAQDASQDAYRDALLAAYRDALLAAKDETIAELREQLRKERRANDENRRLLLAALERIPPQLEAAQEPPQDAPSDA